MAPYPYFVGPSYSAPSVLADGEKLINFFVAQNKAQGAKCPTMLCPWPGAVAQYQLPQSPIRGLFDQQDRSWAGAGSRIIEFTNGIITDRGDIGLDSRQVRFSTNGDGGDQIVFCSAHTLKLLDRTTNVLSTVLQGADYVGLIDEFFIVLDTQSGTIKASKNLDGTSWNGAAIQQRGSASDPWKSMVISGGKAYVIGEETSDVYYDAGTTPFPLAPIASQVIPCGTCAPDSAIDFNGTVVWVSQTSNGARRVVAADGYSGVKTISTPALDAILRGYPRVSDAESLVWEQDGISHLVINFPSGPGSWQYTTDGGWSMVGTYNPPAMGYDAWHARCHAYSKSQGLNLVGDRTTGTIYRLDPTYGLDVSGAIMRRERVAPGICTELRNLSLNSLVLYVDGNADESGQGSDPVVMLTKSRNGGKTWPYPERWKQLGKRGNFGKMVRWNMLGAGRDVTFRFVMTDPSPNYVLDAFLNSDT